jgi:hypothetical protein
MHLMMGGTGHVGPAVAQALLAPVRNPTAQGPLMPGKRNVPVFDLYIFVKITQL